MTTESTGITIWMKADNTYSEGDADAIHKDLATALGTDATTRPSALYARRRSLFEHEFFAAVPEEPGAFLRAFSSQHRETFAKHNIFKLCLTSSEVETGVDTGIDA